MTKPPFEVSYDEDSDVLYVSIGPAVASTSDEGAPGVLWRHSMKNGNTVGVTILDYDFYWKSRKDELASDISEEMNVSVNEARDLLEKVGS